MLINLFQPILTEKLMRINQNNSIFIYYLIKSHSCYLYIRLYTSQLSKMTIQKRTKATTAVLPQVDDTLQMQNTSFNKQSNIATNIKLQQQQIRENSSPLISFQDVSQSNNPLNIAFIAEDSKHFFSDSSQSFSSLGFSRISSIKSQENGSPHYFSLDLDLSGFSQMDSWSNHSHISFTKQNFKRNKPQEIQDENQEIQRQYTKKKMIEKNGLRSITQQTKGMRKATKINRKKSKQNLMFDEMNSSEENLLDIIKNIKENEKGASISNNKNSRKQQR